MFDPQRAVRESIEEARHAAGGGGLCLLLAAAVVIILAFALAACQTIASDCDIHYTGPPPQHYLDAGRQADREGRVLRSVVSADDVREACGQTPVGCSRPILETPNGTMWGVILVDDPSPWGMTPEEVDRHELAHVGGWPGCHPV